MPFFLALHMADTEMAPLDFTYFFLYTCYAGKHFHIITNFYFENFKSTKMHV